MEKNVKVKKKVSLLKRGRKPVEDKIIQLSVYAKTSVIDRWGGKESAKLYAEDYLNNNIPA